ncbi:MAG TPA: protein kinase [Chthoniobacterales bacterium]
MDETVYFQHYRICTDEHDLPEEVSRSGAAINYKAVDTDTGEAVVLQVIPLAAIAPAKLEQFEQRAQAVQKLDHVNIARVREAGTDHGRFVFVSEYLQGETADSWVIAHGTLAPDAVLRVALQVVRAIGAAAFQGLTHRAIQPANLLIVPGPAPEGGWPLVKLLNFDVAGVELHSASGETRELAPSLPPQFASPEQLRGGEIDFRSEMYSLAATMCFLLAGAVPLAVAGKSVRARLRSLPELRRAPRRLHKLLAQMLHDNPEMRPQDPVAVEKEIQKLLGIAQPREQVVRSLTPVAPVLPERPASGPTPLTQMWRGVIAFAALLLLGGVAAAFLFPKAMPWHHRADIGKPIGVPERSTSLPPQNSAMTAANQPQAPPPAPAASTADQPAPVEERQERTTTVTAVADPPERIATATGQDSSHSAAPERQQSTAKAQSATIATGPSSSEGAASEGQESTAKAESRQAPTEPATSASSASRTIAENATRTPPTAEQSEAAPLAEAVTSHAKSERTTAASETKTPGEVAHDTSTTAPTRRSDSSKRKSRVAKVEEKPPKAIAIDPALAAEEDEAIRRAGQVRAQFVGTSGDGRLLLRLPSGQIVTVTPRNEQEHAVEPRRHRRPTEPEDYPRAQPVNPDDEQPRD